jgi:hypothetical protein
LTPVGPADVEVTELAQVAQRHVAAHADSVGADAPVGLVDECVRLRFGARVLSDARRASVDPAVRAHVVVVANDVVKDELEFTEGRRGTFGEEPL